MTEFTQDQILEIKKIIGDQYKMKGMNWRIVQSIPEILEPNTLYFHQVSINPKKFKLIHTDKDKDVAILDLFRHLEINIYTNNSSAIEAGETSGSIYHNGDGILRIVY